MTYFHGTFGIQHCPSWEVLRSRRPCGRIFYVAVSSWLISMHYFVKVEARTYPQFLQANLSTLGLGPGRAIRIVLNASYWK